MAREGRWLDTIYCDDVRMEVGNKKSLMGVYESDMLLGDVPPAALPKLCIVLRAWTAKELMFRSLSFRVEMNGVSLLETGNLLENETLAPQPDAPIHDFTDPDWAYRYFSISVVLQVTPFTLEKVPSLLKVCAIADNDEVLWGRPLRILPPPPVVKAALVAP